MSKKNVLVESTKSKFQVLAKKPANVLKRIKGVLSDFGSNRNGRIYPRELWENVLDSDYVKEMINSHGLVGELDHPEERLEISLQEVSHVINDMWIEGDQVVGVIDILPTPNGKIVNELLDYGTDIGISSRGAGSVGAGNIVDPDYQFITFDFVARPSCEAARLNTILEGVKVDLETNSDDKVNSILESYKSGLKESNNYSDWYKELEGDLYKNNGYIHFSPKEIDEQEIKGLKNEILSRGGKYRVAEKKFYIDGMIFTLDPKTGITVEFDKDAKYETVPIKEAEEIKYKDKFEAYCKGRIKDLGKTEVEYYDRSGFIKVALIQDIRDYGTCKVLDPQDCADILDIDYENLAFIKEDGELVATPMISTDLLVARLEFDEIDRKFYKNLIKYWDDMGMEDSMEQSDANYVKELDESTTQYNSVLIDTDEFGPIPVCYNLNKSMTAKEIVNYIKNNDYNLDKIGQEVSEKELKGAVYRCNLELNESESIKLTESMSDQEVYKVVLNWYKDQIEKGNMTLNQCYELLSDKAKVSLNKLVDQSKIRESIMSDEINKLLKEAYSLGDDKESFDVFDASVKKLNEVCDYIKEYCNVDFTNIEVEPSQDNIYTADFTVTGIPEDKISEEVEDDLRNEFCSGWDSIIDNIQLENWGGPKCFIMFDIDRAYNNKSKFGRIVKQIIDKLMSVNESSSPKTTFKEGSKDEIIGSKYFFITKFADDDSRNGEEVEITNYKDDGRVDIKFVKDGKELKDCYDNEVKRVTYKLGPKGKVEKLLCDDLGEYLDKIVAYLNKNGKKGIKESSTEEYWDATEIERDGFLALLKRNNTKDEYLITIDANEVKRFKADSEDDAKKEYEIWKRKEKGKIDWDFDNSYDRICEDADEDAETLRALAEELKDDPIVKKNMYNGTWLSGEETTVYPITVSLPGKDITIQLNNDKNVYTNLIKRYEDNYPVKGYFWKSDGSCPSTLTFKLNSFYNFNESQNYHPILDKEPEVSSPIELNSGVLPVIDADQYSRESFFDNYEVENEDDWSKVYEAIDKDTMIYGAPIVEEYIKKVLPSAEVEATGMYHPKEYNFASDELEFNVSFDPKEFKALEEKVINDPDFKEFLSKYRSRDGFISYMADDLDEYKEEDGWKKFVQVIMYCLKDENFEETNERLWEDILYNGSLWEYIKSPEE